MVGNASGLPWPGIEHKMERPKELSGAPVPPDLPRNPEESYNPADAWLQTHAGLLGRGAWSRSTDFDETLPNPSPAPADIAFIKALRAEDLPSHVSAYQLVRRIGEGGWGEVWEATQSALGRPIAIKRLRKSLLAPEAGVTPDDARIMEQLFRQEAIVTAHLEHPNIIPIHDLGRDEDGRPILAMKMVRGRLWKDILQEDFAKNSIYDFLTKHLQILIKVAQAVAFAHSQGIVHRDLKPSQVMIGPFGEAVLMDWGLALVYRRDAAFDAGLGQAFPPDAELPIPIYPINPAGTPSYMAPEQTEETVRNIGPWTDVYLLGGILYHLLTGRPPHPLEVSETAYRMAQEGFVEPPEKAAPLREIPPALSSLAMRALARDPKERISSALDFVESLQDCLTGADQRRESIRLASQAATHIDRKTADYEILADCLNTLERSLLLWPGNLAARRLRQRALAQYARAARDNRDLKLARLYAERLDPTSERDLLLGEIARLEEEQRRQDERLAEALREAEMGRDRAEKARRIADDMRARAESLVRFLLKDLHRDLKSVGRLDPMRRVSQKSLEYFDALPESETTPQALNNRAIAYLYIGDVFSDEGKKPEAAAAYRKARDIAQSLTALDPGQIEWQITLADCYDRCGQVSYHQGQIREAMAEYEAALQIREPIGRALRGDPSIEAGIASSRHKIGVAFWRQQELPRALSCHLESLATFRLLLENDPGNEDLLASLSWTLSTLGNVYRDMGQVDEAQRVTSEALRIREDLAERQPSNLARQDEVLWTRGNLALIYLLQSRLEESLEMFQKDIAQRRRLSEIDPTNVVRKGSIAFSLSLTGEILFALERLEEAEHLIRECLDLTEELLRKDPTSTHVLGSNARLVFQLAELLAARGQWDECFPLVKEAVELARRCTALTPKNVTVIKVLIGSLILLGRIRKRNGAAESPKPLWDEASQLLQAIRITGTELDLIDLKAQLLLLEGKAVEAQPLLEALHKRRWITPTMKSVCRDVGVGYPGCKDAQGRE